MQFRLRTLLTQFTIRDMLLLTVVAGILISWWIDRTRLVQQPPPAIEDRYEVVMSGKDGEKAYLFNPRTGEMWLRQSNGKWKNHAQFAPSTPSTPKPSTTPTASPAAS